MTPQPAPAVGVFILARNEAANIARCLDALAGSGWKVHVLDSGSSDDTREIASRYPDVSVQSWNYVDHCSSYNEVLTGFAAEYRVAVILDADMLLATALRNEMQGVLDAAGTSWDALRAPVEMWVEAHPLHSGSLYPPKPFAFATGKPLFTREGHGEKLVDGARVRTLEGALRHDDRKPYASYLQSQARYAGKLIERLRQGEISGKDRLRIATPLLVFAVPLVSFVFKLGFLSGRAGIVYALDRLIAEAVMYRSAVAARLADKPRRR